MDPVCGPALGFLCTLTWWWSSGGFLSGQGLDTTPTSAASGTVVQHFCFLLLDCATDYRAVSEPEKDKSSTDLTGLGLLPV